MSPPLLAEIIAMKNLRFFAIATITVLGLFGVEQKLWTVSPQLASVANAGSSQVQESTVSLNADDLSQPHVLRIFAPQSSSSLSGSVSFNGRVIHSLRGRGTKINLSPYLRRGRNVVKISGYSSPSSASVEVEFSGPGTHINQTSSGTGSLNQRIVLDVQ